MYSHVGDAGGGVAGHAHDAEHQVHEQGQLLDRQQVEQDPRSGVRSRTSSTTSHTALSRHTAESAIWSGVIEGPGHAQSWPSRRSSASSTVPS